MELERASIFFIKKNVKFICSRIKKKAEAESKNCHAKTMLILEKPIKLI